MRDELKTLLFAVLLLLYGCNNNNNILVININTTWNDTVLAKPFRVLNSGAAVLLDITDYAGSNRDINYIEKIMPPKTISIILKDTNGKNYQFTNNDGFYIGNDKVIVIVSPLNELAFGTKFVEMRIKTSGISIDKAKISWRDSAL